MKYLAHDTIDTTMNPYPEELKSICITIRGTKNLFDIFFSASDVETSFNIALPVQIDFTWINTPSGKEKYLSYPTLKRMLFQLKDNHELVAPYLTWVDSLIFSNSKVKPFFRYSSSSTSSIPTAHSEDFSDIDDSSSISSIDSIQNNEYILKALQHKVDQLEHQLEIKDRDMRILEGEIKLRDKEIELLQLKLSIPLQSNWV